ncbi:MAG: hypothetical protein H7210_05060 [Pyrinomonadaceae bacterium]|nr:hypothetical protein [Phycisphaerales bacterium]
MAPTNHSILRCNITARRIARLTATAAVAMSAPLLASQPADSIKSLTAQPVAPALQPLPPLDVTSTDFAAEIQKLVEEFQPPSAKTADAVNGWPKLIEAAAILYRLQQEARPAGDAADGGPVPNFQVFLDKEFAAGMADDERQTVEDLTRKLLERAIKAGVPAKLAEARRSSRMIRARVDSPERAAQNISLGADDEYDGRLFNVLLPEVGMFRHLARMNAVLMQEAAASGDWRGFTDAMENNLAIGRACVGQMLVIDRLVGSAIHALTITTALKQISLRQPSEDVLAVVSAAVERQLMEPPPLDCQLRGERPLDLDCFRWVFENADKLDAKQLADLTGRSEQSTIPVTLGGLNRDTCVRLVEEMSLKCRQYAVLPATQRLTAETPDEWFESQRGPETLLVGILLPAVQKACASEDLISITRAGFRAVLAVERCQRQTGRWPTSWEDVIARGLLTAPPADVVTGQTLRYKLLDALDAQGRTYLIYSIGTDMEDNGGIEDVSGTNPRFYAINNIRKGKGFDYVVNQR